MSASPDYPFGIAPTDAFSVATCPACAGRVGPRMYYCPSCFAADDLAKAREDILFRGGPEATVARYVYAILIVLGLLFGAIGLVLAGVGVLAAMGSALVLLGVVGWLVYPRLPREASILAFVIVSLLTLADAAYALLVGGSLIAFALLVALATILRGTFAGIRIGGRVARLRRYR